MTADYRPARLQISPHWYFEITNLEERKLLLFTTYQLAKWSSSLDGQPTSNISKQITKENMDPKYTKELANWSSSLDGQPTSNISKQITKENMDPKYTKELANW